MQDQRGYHDIDFFNQEFKTNQKHYQPIVLTRFYLYRENGSDFGLDQLRNVNSWDKLITLNVHWTAHAVIRNLDWLSENGRKMLRDDLHMTESSLKLHVARGEVEVLTQGRLTKPPQYMNSDDVPFGLRVQALKEPLLFDTSSSDRSTHTVNTNRYYVVRSLHIRTYAISLKFLDQYRVQHFIVEICKKGRRTKSNTSTVEWLVQEFQSMWKDAAKLNLVNGAPPRQCDILHYLALHVEQLIEWSSHSGPVQSQIWREFAGQVTVAKEVATGSDIRWGYFIGEDEPVERGREDGLLAQRHSQQQGRIERGHCAVLEDNDLGVTEQTGSHFFVSKIQMLEEFSFQSDPIWNDVPLEFQLPTHISCSLLWRCPCPLSHSSSPCRFEIYLKKPSNHVRAWLSQDDLDFLCPTNGSPSWDKCSVKLSNILVKLICHHFAYDHLEKSGIYIRDGALTRVIQSNS